MKFARFRVDGYDYTVSNDISGADYRDAFMWRMKCSDTFGPVGPWIEATIDPHKLDIITRVDGREEDRGSTRDMIHDCYAIVSNISQYCTLHPGDLITTGAPGSTRPLRPGEVVEVEIPGIGLLRNPIAAARGWRPRALVGAGPGAGSSLRQGRRFLADPNPGASVDAWHPTTRPSPSDLSPLDGIPGLLPAGHIPGGQVLHVRVALEAERHRHVP